MSDCISFYDEVIMEHLRRTIIALTLLLLAANARAQQPQMDISVLSAGAGTSSGDGIILRSTLGQPIVGRADGTSTVASAGFWYQARAVAGIVVVNNPPSMPQIVEPAAGSEVMVGGAPDDAPLDPDTSFTLRWTGGIDPDGDTVRYSWQIATESDFSNVLYSQEVGTSDEFAITLNLLADILDDNGIGLGESITVYHRIVATDGENDAAGPSIQITFTRGTLVSTEEPSRSLPKTFRLHQNYPNPFNPSTTIAYDVPERSWVRLSVYDVFGRELSRLVDEAQAPGRYTVMYSPRALASGLYLYRIDAGTFQAVGRMLLVK